MSAFQAKINASGRILVPVSLRRELDLKADDDVLLRVENGALLVTPMKKSLHHVQGKVHLHNMNNRRLTDVLYSIRDGDD